jgi:hypothetical protein
MSRILASHRLIESCEILLSILGPRRVSERSNVGLYLLTPWIRVLREKLTSLCS